MLKQISQSSRELVIRLSLLTLFFFLLLADKDFALSQNSFYHYQIARLYSSGTFNLARLGILELSSFHDHFTNQHFFYHLFLVPFVALIPGLLALKAANATLLSLLTLALSKTLAAIKIPNPYFWGATIPFLQAGAFSRLFWERPDILGIACLLLLISLLASQVKSKDRALGVLAFFYAGFSYFSLLMLPITALWIYVHRATHSTHRSRRAWAPVAWVALGLCLGLLFSRHPLANIRYMAELIASVTGLDGRGVLVLEWEAPSHFVNSYYLLIALLTAGLADLIRKPENATPERLFFAILSSASGLLTLKIARFECYFTVFTPCLALSLWGKRNIWAVSRQLFSNVLKKTPPGASAQQSLSFRDLAFVLAGALIFLQATLNLTQISRSFQGVSSRRSVKAFMEWYSRGPYKNQKFIIDRWESWSEVFYFDPSTKAEPGYSMSIYARSNPELFATYGLLRSGHRQDWTHPDFALRLARDFKSKLLLVQSGSALEKTLRQMAPTFTRLYEDAAFTFFKIHDEPDWVPTSLPLSAALSKAIGALAIGALNGSSPTITSETTRLGVRLDALINQLPLQEQNLLKDAEIFTTITDHDTDKLIGCVSNRTSATTLSQKMISSVIGSLNDPRFREPHLGHHYGRISISILFDKKPLSDIESYRQSMQKQSFALHLTSNGKNATLLAGPALEYSSTHDQLLKILKRKAGIDESEAFQLSLSNQVTLSFDPNDLTYTPQNTFATDAQESAQAAARFLLSMQKADGSFFYFYDPYSAKHIDESGREASQDIRLILPAQSLCLAAKTLSASRLLPDLRVGCEKALRHLQTKYPDVSQISHLGIKSVLGLAYLEGGHVSRLARIRDSIIGHFDSASGSFFTTLEDQSRSGENIYAGEALLFLARYTKLKQDARSADIVRAALPYYASLYSRTRDVFMIRWFYEAYSLAADDANQSNPSNQTIQSLGKQMLTDLLSSQSHEPEVVPHLEGCLIGQLRGSPRIRQPNYISGLILEGLVERKDLNDLQISLASLRSCVLRQQITRTNAEELHSPHEAIGGFPISVEDRRVRVDLHSHIMNGLLRSLPLPQRRQEL